MATPADTRLLELLDKWLKSLELHTRYASLDDATYWKLQRWMEHQRPSLWIINVAKQKTLALRTQVLERIKSGDTMFAESLELMTFLANLIGSEHIERFIPLAEPDNERPLGAPPSSAAAANPEGADSATGVTREMPTLTSSATREMPKFAPTAATGTREMPQFLQQKPAPPPAPQATPQVARTERKPALTPKSARAGGKAGAKSGGGGKKAAAEASAPPEGAREQVIADAQRLVQWGRKWYELPELIARMADRPTLPEVRRILKENKAAIEKKSGN